MSSRTLHIVKLLVALATGLAMFAEAAGQAARPACPLSSEFDFWLGEWAVRWTAPDKRELEGRNRIRRALDGCAILEEFDGAPGSPLKGISVTVYDPARKVWKQTWVDNQSSYLDFEGGFADGRMVLARSAVVNGVPVRQRMVFHGIAPDAFTWDWQRSRDEGKTWETTWQLRYTRLK
jgi:hypothetical protein